MIYPVTGQVDFEEFRNLAVRIIVTAVDENLPKFESELEKVVHELRTVSKVDNSVESEDGEEVEVKSLLDLMEEYIQALEDLSKDDIKALKVMSKQLYIEAQNQ